MGLDELWEKIKNSAGEAGKDFGEFMKEGTKEAAQKTWEEVKKELPQVWEKGKEQARREWRRQSAPIPQDVEKILAETPETDTPVILYRDDTIPFLDDTLDDPYFEQGWAPGTIKGRPVRILLPSKGAVFTQIALKYLKEHQREHEEMRKNAEVPQDVRNLIDHTPRGKDPVIKHREELGIYVDPDQDLGQVLEQGYFLGTIHSRQVRLDIRHMKSEIREWKDNLDELEQFYKSR